ncbi:MAG: cation transporter [Phycisphaerae bacterium]|nr:cation transporter [Phycisphaerae bacterium]
MEQQVKKPERLTPRRVTFLGLVMNLTLAGAKIAAGFAFSSKTILADGVHSLTDLVTDFAVLIGLKYGDAPPDESHPYGHRRVHTLVALFVGIVLLVTAGWIGLSAIMQLHGHTAKTIDGPIPLILALLTIPAKELLFRLTRRVSRRDGNPALLANAWHHRSDAVTSIVAAVGIAGAMFLGPKWAILDDITAAVLAAFILAAAAKMILTSVLELTDHAPRPELISRIEKIVADTPGVECYHQLRARKLGGQVDMDIHVLVDPNLTVEQGHGVAKAVRVGILNADLSVQQVIVHIEPYHPAEKP